MPRLDLTDISFVLDRSGSMESVKSATIEAFNGFLKSQRGGAGMAQMTLVQFDDQYEVVFESLPAASAPELTPLTFVPRGSTALLDAMGRTIEATGQRLAAMPEAARPATVLFVTLTDGFENASREFTPQRLNDMIAHQRDVYSWQFLFLGANQDAIATASKMGIGAGQALSFDADSAGTAACLAAVDGHMHAVRSARLRGDLEQQVEFNEADRKASKK